MIYRPPRKRQVTTQIHPELWLRLERASRLRRVTLAEYMRGVLTRHLTHLPDSGVEDETAEQ
jgi:hypothetical protein